MTPGCTPKTCSLHSHTDQEDGGGTHKMLEEVKEGHDYNDINNNINKLVDLCGRTDQ